MVLEHHHEQQQRKAAYKAAYELFKTSLLEFYNDKAPAKAHKVPAILRQFRGREHKIVAGIRKKYKVELRDVDRDVLVTLAAGGAAPSSSNSSSNVKSSAAGKDNAATTASWAAAAVRTTDSITSDLGEGKQRRHNNKSGVGAGGADAGGGGGGGAAAAAVTATSDALETSPRPVTSPKVYEAARKSASRHGSFVVGAVGSEAATAAAAIAAASGLADGPVPDARSPPKQSRRVSGSKNRARRPSGSVAQEAETQVGNGTVPVNHVNKVRGEDAAAPSKSEADAIAATAEAAVAKQATTGEDGSAKKKQVHFNPELKNRSAIKVHGYSELRYIGRGKFATAYRAIRAADGKPVALKHIHGYADLKPKQKKRQHQEIRFLQKLEHPNIVHYFDSFKHEGSLIIVCEWAAAGDLKRQIQKIVAKGKYLSELNIWKYFHQIASAVQYMHQHRILHRDLKPANILLTAEGQIKVTDFGLSRGVSDDTAVIYSKVGTPLYMAPEVIIGKGYGWASDIWSLGCILYELTNLINPFREKGLDLKSLFQKVCRAEIPAMVGPGTTGDRYSSHLRKLISRMLQKEPAKRPSMDEVVGYSQKMLELLARRRVERKGGSSSASSSSSAAATGAPAASTSPNSAARMLKNISLAGGPPTKVTTKRSAGNNDSTHARASSAPSKATPSATPRDFGKSPKRRQSKTRSSPMRRSKSNAERRNSERTGYSNDSFASATE